MSRITIALLHHPVLDKGGNLYTTSITNVDVHDIARAACTYDLAQYYIISPILAQREMAQTIANFWVHGSGHEKNKDRSDALSLIDIQPDLASSIAKEEAVTGARPLLISTSAKLYPDKNIDFGRCSELMLEAKSVILLFGTGYGLADSVLEQSDHVLEPIDGRAGYNHLSVRSAASIILDRLLGRG